MSLNKDAMVQVVIEETIHYTREMRLCDLEEYAEVPLVGLDTIEDVQAAIEGAVASGPTDGLAELETDMQESQEVASTTWHVYDLERQPEGGVERYEDRQGNVWTYRPDALLWNTIARPNFVLLLEDKADPLAALKRHLGES